MKKIIFTALIIMLTFSCSKEDGITEDSSQIENGSENTATDSDTQTVADNEVQVTLEPCFTLEKTTYEIDEEITINNCSKGASSYNFDFGNGTSSIDENPTSINYDEAGSYTITLTINDSNGNSESTSETIAIIRQSTPIVVNNYSEGLLNFGYNYGILPTNVNKNDVTSAYNSWKNTFTESCGNGSVRVNFDIETQTVSEGVGYGMLIAAYAGDQDLLDGLWNYYNTFLNEHGVMHWKIEGCSTVLGQNGATDAELDVAMALIIAHNRWGSMGNINYENDAKSLIAIIKEHEIEANTYILKPGDVWGGSSTTNISYFAPAYYRAYKSVTNDSSWDIVASKSYDIIDANQSQTGAVYNLVSDWCKADGTFSSEVASWADFEGKRYHYDAARTPWRITLDYLWTGNTRALDYANKCIDFVNSKNGFNNIYPGYNLDGTAYDTTFKDVTFTGAYAVAAMASNDQDFIDDAYTQVYEMPSEAYFGSTLKVLYLLTLSGNFYNNSQFQ